MPLHVESKPAGRGGWALAVAALVGLGLLGLRASSAGQEPPQPQRAFQVVAHKYAFEPARIEVDQNDLVKITLRSSDIAHSFTVDGYRIAKRVGAGQTVTFEFRADQPGTFRFYCNLKQDERCREMQGELIVHPH
jgi:heme/copper-type cytochrome/quinol oxidase subunit 2